MTGPSETSFVSLESQQADLATGRERQLATGKRAERTKHDFRCLICRSAILCHWSSQLFDLRTPLSTDVPVLLLNQPNVLDSFLENKIDFFSHGPEKKKKVL